MILMALGVVLGLTGGSNYIPDFLMKFMEIAGDCMTPLGMILTGMVIGKLMISDMFKDYKTYIITALRLFLLPLAGMLVFWLLGIRGEMAIIGVLFLSLPGGVNTIVFPEAFGGDSTAGARIVFNTNILGVITIPVMLSLASLWLG